jgi:type IV pilus assembly protein PilV
MLIPRHPLSLASRQHGAALLEALLAVLVFAFGVLALVGLQANATQATTKAKFRADAGLLASQCVAEIWLDRASLISSPTNCTCPMAAKAAAANNNLPNGAVTPACTTITVNSDYQVTVTVTWQGPNDSGANTHQAIAHITSNLP